MIFFVIALGGALGSVLRYSIGRVFQRLSAAGFPVGTLVVNVVGCVLVGALTRYFMNDETSPLLRGALIVGFCGGFTTFSAFSLETVGLLYAGDWPKAGAYVASSLIACLAGTALGFSLAGGFMSV